jgi:aminoglycoside phosphotransferase family enzyme/predicted kinase
VHHDGPPTALAAAVHETHIGLVVLAGDRAYKVKKAVRTPFLDFSTPQLRAEALRRELALNRRLSPDVYLGLLRVSPVSPEGTPAPGEPAEHALVMRRMPAERSLAALVGAGADVTGDLRALARLVAAFHSRAERGPHIAVEGGRDRLRARWQANIDELRTLDGPDAATVDEVETLAVRFLEGRAPLLGDRAAHNRIVDGHGDLIAADVFCLDDGPRVLDCLEFDDRLRFVDCLDDVAFLAMDLERLGRPDLGDRFLDAYVEFSGDPAPASLRHHYIAYRGLVRAKVAWIRHAQGDPDAAADAQRYTDIVLRHLRAGNVRLVLVGGLPGTGKTTVAGGLADRFGAVVLSSDRVRKELAGIDPTTPAGAGYREGIYSPERTEKLYTELLDRVERLLARGESVVLDASWTAQQHRRSALATAQHTHSELLQLECEADAEATSRRIRDRIGAASDATPAIAAAMAAQADPWPEATPIDTSRSVAESLAAASAAWHAAGDERRR